MASMGEDMAREILLKLPTRDLARCSCVCKLWRDVARDPSFRALHGDAAHVVSSSGETLLVDEFHGRGMGSELTVLDATSLKPIGRFAEVLAVGYSPANACNAFLLLASAALDSPLCVFNPVTGEKLAVPAPPANEHVRRRCMYAMGFSSEPTAGVYKLFRLSFPRTSWPDACYVDVYTLGAGIGEGVWRRHPDLFQARYNVQPPPPVLIDGKLYVVIEGGDTSGAPDRKMLVIDVVSEVHTLYDLPRMVVDGAAAVHAFELSGKLCVAIRVIGRRRVSFWVLRQLEVPWLYWRMPDWERRHAFNLDADDGGYGYGDKPCCAWLDGGDGTLCYRFGDCVYKYDTTKKTKTKRQMKLRVTPLWWNVYGGFRPSLVSPHVAFTSAGLLLLQEHREKQEEFQHTMRPQPESSKKRCPPDCSKNHHGANKRIREHF